ncbi:MAG: hypothetical protein JXA64_06075 [Candidatus Fermentibacteraceae bacterium]|nr:hypothetical protein [Candidatus Fermentibacteraceae bacterium]MBN2608664.1 hypothetical protein [Candidatus Fermentibacteraceae bacterium]
MINLVLTMTALLLASPESPGEVLPAFRDSILSGDPDACMEMISRTAWSEIDSVMANHPRQMENILSFFGLQEDYPGLAAMDGRELLQTLLAGEEVKAYLLLFSVTPEEPVSLYGETFVPVTWGVFGNRNTFYVQLVKEDGVWRIRDFFDALPVQSAPVRTGRSA